MKNEEGLTIKLTEIKARYHYRVEINCNGHKYTGSVRKLKQKEKTKSHKGNANE